MLFMHDPVVTPSMRAKSVERPRHCLLRRLFELGRTPLGQEGQTMRAATRFLGAVGVLLLCCAGAASAQHPQHREGFWIGFGFGYGSANGTCTGCSSASEGGVTGFLKLGGTLSPNVLLGGAVNAFSKASN